MLAPPAQVGLRHVNSGGDRNDAAPRPPAGAGVDHRTVPAVPHPGPAPTCRGPRATRDPVVSSARRAVQSTSALPSSTARTKSMPLPGARKWMNAKAPKRIGSNRYSSGVSRSVAIAPSPE